MRAGLALAVILSLRATSGLSGEIPAAERRSGSTFMSPAIQDMQADPTANPGLLWVQDGQAAWVRKAGAADLSCADCHGAAETALSGVAARYPAFDEAMGRPIELAGRVNACRVRHQRADPLPLEAEELLSLTAFIGQRSQGAAIAPPTDPRLDPHREAGRRLYEQRLGQLDLACSQCHDEHWGRSLGGAPIPQAHPTGYPIYRLEWQAVGSLQRRLRNCLVGVRAEPWPLGAPELIELELYLMSRASGLPIETPAVRP